MRMDLWEPAAGDAAGKGTVSGTFCSLSLRILPLCWLTKEKGIRNWLDVEWSSLSRELMKRRILSTETTSAGIANAAKLEERHRETLGK